MKMTKKILAFALSLIMIVSMFSVIPMSVSADATRADSWNGFITTTLNVGARDPIDEENYFTLTETDLYVGDSIKANTTWLNYALNYTNEEGETASSEVTGMPAWYCDDTYMFSSQLQFSKINGATDNNPVKFTKAGTWRLYANLKDGKQVTLITFEVKELSRFITGANGEAIFTGAKEIDIYPQDGVPFSEDEIYVGDTIKNSTGGDWWGGPDAKQKYPISYTKEDGTVVTGVITHLHLYGPNADFYYSTWNGDENVYTFAKAGTYRVHASFEQVTNADGETLDSFEADIRTFEVKAFPRQFGTLDGAVTFDANKNVNVYAETGIPFSTDDLYVGDTLQNGSGWWRDYTNIAITYEDVDYTAKITYLTIDAPTTTDFHGAVWNSGAINYTLAEAGTYKVYGQAEAVKNVETGESAGTISKVLLRTFEVKDAPRQYIDLEGNKVYGGTKAIKFYPQDGVPFSEDEIYVGDTIQNSTGGDWWGGPDAKQKYPISYTKEDGTVVTGVITHLHLYGPNADLYFSLWQGNTNVLTFKNAGTYRVNAKFEKVTDAEGNDVGDFTADLRTFEVKECPHNYELTETVEANCATGGYELYTCSYCAATEKRNETEVSGEHNYELAETVEATCDTKGYEIYHCEACGTDVKQNYVDALGHDLTCTDNVVTCSACDYTRTYDAENTTVEIKVNDASGKTNYTTAEAAAFVGETLVNTNGGYWTDYNFTSGDYTGKVYNAWVVKGDMAYFEEYRTNRLADDNYTDENVFHAQVGFGSAINYTFDEAGTYNLIGVIQYTETSNFLTDVHPFVMATIEVFDVAGEEPPHEHDYNTEIIAATCTEAGKTVYTCDCGDSYEEVIDALGHTEVTTTVDATCTADGSITVTCDVCGETLSTEVIPATGHNYVDGACDVCGEADPDAPVGPTYAESLAVYGCSVIFESDYSVRVYVLNDTVAPYSSVKLVASKAIYDETGFVRYEEIELTNPTVNSSYHLYDYTGFAAKEIASEIKLHLVATDAEGNEFYGPEKPYSLKEYALNQIKKSGTDAKFRTMMVDFLNYGAAAQVYFEYNVNALANVGAEDYQDCATPTREYTSVKGGLEDASYATQIRGVSLVFENKVNIRGYVLIKDQDINDIKANWYGEATYVDAKGETKTQRIDLSTMTSSSGFYVFSFNNLYSKEMSIPVNFTLYNADGEQMSNTAVYSIESYVVGTSTMGENIKNLSQALIKFGDSAKAYLTK